MTDIKPEIPTFPPPPRRSTSLTAAAAISLVFGFGGAFLFFWFFPDVRQAIIPPGTQSVIVERPGKVVVEESSRLRDLGTQNQRLVAGIYHSDAALAIGSTTLYPANDSIGVAIILTADGWFATVDAAGARLDDILVIEGQPYKIEKLITDTISPFVIGKIAADRLTPVSFDDRDERYSGMTLWSLDGTGEVLKTALRSKYNNFFSLADDADSPAIISSDRLSLGLTLAAKENLLSGTPIFNLAGQLVGLSVSSDEAVHVVVPSNTLQSFMINVLKYGKPNRSYFGVSYLFDNGGAETNHQTAAVIYGEKLESGVAAKSPAARAGFRRGDLLLSVNDIPILSPDDLFVLLRRYSPGESAIIEFMRGDISNEVTVNLSETSARQ